MAETVTAPTYALITDANAQMAAVQANLTDVEKKLRGKFGLHPRDVKLLRDQILGQVVTAKTATQAVEDATQSA